MLAPTPRELLLQARRTGGRILLVRHGQPAIALKPVTCHKGFGDYIQAYDASGLDTVSRPPLELRAQLCGMPQVFTSGRRRSDDSARALVPEARMIADSLFAEAPLASPRIPLLRLTVSQWAVASRLFWHLGFHPGVESARAVRQRVCLATDRLVAQLERGGDVLLVAHGYFNFLLGRELRRRGFKRDGRHRARYWNAVEYYR